MREFIEDFKIYVPVVNEERLIAHTVGALKEVFDPRLIEVIDIGSEDRTIQRVPSDVKVTQVALPKASNCRTSSISGLAFTEMKNAFSRKQKWVLWVDGDEIYPLRTSRGIVEWLKKAQAGDVDKKSLRLYWRMLKVEGGVKYHSEEFMSAGGKVFSSDHIEFNRAWPEEVFRFRTGPGFPKGLRSTSKRAFNGMWFWHGVLLKRSGVLEPTYRRKKRESKLARYNSIMTWRAIDKWPWEKGYVLDPITDWTVLHMNLNSGNTRKWTGVWKGDTITRNRKELSG